MKKEFTENLPSGKFYTNGTFTFQIEFISSKPR